MFWAFWKLSKRNGYYLWKLTVLLEFKTTVANNFGKSMNPTIPSSIMSKLYDRLTFFNFGMAASLEEGKLNITPVANIARDSLWQALSTYDPLGEVLEA